LAVAAGAAAGGAPPNVVGAAHPTAGTASSVSTVSAIIFMG
jgi:hypothetical protein